MSVRVDEDVLKVLSRATVTDTYVQLPDEQLERKLYEKVAKALLACGFKWDRKAGHHVGQGTEAVEQLLLTGTYVDEKREFDAFYTPPELALRVVQLAAIEPGMTVLEPSAGVGALTGPALVCGGHVIAIEKNARSAATLRELAERDGADKLKIIEADFLVDIDRFGPKDGIPDGPKTHVLSPLERCVMNPPFSKSQDAKHVLHALKFIKPGGRLVSIMSAGFTFRRDGAYGELHKWLDAHADEYHVEALPEGSFKASGTGVNTVILEVRL